MAKTTQDNLLNLAHEIWALAQLHPEEGIEDGVIRIFNELKASSIDTVAGVNMKACPLCKCQPRSVFDGRVICSNITCVLARVSMSQESWNTRLIEDGLLRKITALRVDRAKWQKIATDATAKLKAHQATAKNNVED